MRGACRKSHSPEAGADDLLVYPCAHPRVKEGHQLKGVVVLGPYQCLYMLKKDYEFVKFNPPESWTGLPW